MDAVTYPTKEVVDFVNEYLVPLRIEVSKKSYYERYNVIWTPTLLMLDYQGYEIQRKVGFLDVVEFMSFMHLGIAKVHLNIKEFDAANVHLKRLFDHFPDSNAVPEAIFFSGVNHYKQNNDPMQLKGAYEKLSKDYPKSSWAKRAMPYRFIQQ